MVDDQEHFRTQIPDIGDLRKQYTEIADLLNGIFALTPNVYPFEEGTVISWTLEQGDQRNPAYVKDPTYGRIPMGTFTFTTAHIEVVHVLNGTLEAKVGNNAPEIVSRGQTITSYPNCTLQLKVQGSPVFYFCEYLK